MIRPMFEFSGNIGLNFDDPKTKVARKILIFSSNTEEYNIIDEHNKAIENGYSAIPYHYVIQNNKGGNGEISYTRPKMFINDLSPDKANLINHCVVILIVGKHGTISNEQISSLSSLCADIILSEGITIESIVDATLLGEKVAVIANWDDFIYEVKRIVESKKPLLSTPLPSEDYYRIVSDKNLKTIDSISIYTGVPKDIISRMNLHLPEGVIPFGTVIFLPKNRLIISAQGMFLKDFSFYVIGR